MKKIIPFNNVVEFNTDVKEITAISLEHEIKKYPDMISGVFYISGEYKITEGLLEKEKFNFELPFDIALTNNYQLDSLLVDIDDFRYELISDKKLKVNIDLYIDGEEIYEPAPRYIYTEELTQDKEVDIRTQTDESSQSLQEVQEKISKENITESKELNNLDNDILQAKEKISTTEETLLDDVIDVMTTDELDNEYEEKDDDIEPERIDLLKDMLTSNDKENDMNKDLNLNINTNETENTNDSNNVSITNDLFSPNSEEKYVTYRVYKVVETDTIDTILTKYNITKEMLADYNNIENITPGDKLIIPTNEK